MAELLNKRPDPEKLLRQVEAEEDYNRRGRLKVFLGYASGVGKSYRMLDEARRRKERGQDVVVVALQTARSGEVGDLLQSLEVIPERETAGAKVIDVAAVLRRRPEVCVVDGLAWDNPAGSRNDRRWQDVQQILDAGISVLGSVNLQYIDELRDQVERITGKRSEQSIPKSFLSTADEIVVVDAPADFSLEQHNRDVPDPAGMTRQQKLSALREIALVLAAEVVDKQLEQYLERHDIAGLWGTQERVLVCLTPRSAAAAMIASGKRNAERFHGELVACYVEQSELTAEERTALEANVELARGANAQVRILYGEDTIEAIINFARERGITQIFIGHSLKESLWGSLFGGTVDRLIRAAEGIDVRVFPH